MKHALLSGVCLALAGVTLAAQNYPHAFPRQGVHKLFENERVVAWDVTWLKDIEQPIHRHQFDMAAVYTVYGPIRVTDPQGKVNPVVPFEVPRPFFQPKNVTHKEEAIGFPGAPERQAVMFDLKEVTVAPVSKPGVKPAFPRDGAMTAAIDNARVLEWDYTWHTGKPIAEHVHERDSVEVFFDPGTIRYTTADGKTETKTFKRKDTRWIPRGTVETEEAVAGTPRAVTIELK